MQKHHEKQNLQNQRCFIVILWSLFGYQFLQICQVSYLFIKSLREKNWKIDHQVTPWRWTNIGEVVSMVDLNHSPFPDPKETSPKQNPGWNGWNHRENWKIIKLYDTVFPWRPSLESLIRCDAVSIFDSIPWGQNNTSMNNHSSQFVHQFLFLPQLFHVLLHFC